MDLDTTRTRAAYERIIADFEQGKTDILIGTQMVSKGLDFEPRKRGRHSECGYDAELSGIFVPMSVLSS